MTEAEKNFNIWEDLKMNRRFVLVITCMSG
jgi:hypothetical protein